MEYKDYYAILGVPRAATQADIKKAFRKLARQYHPDTSKGKPGAELRFKEVNEANEVLSDPQKRKAYDQLGANWTAYHQAAGAGMPFEEFLRQARSGGGPPGTGYRGTGGFTTSGGFPGGIRFEYRGSPEDLAGFSDFFRAMFGDGFGAGSDADELTRAGGAAGKTRIRTSRRASGRPAPGSVSGGTPGGASAFDPFDVEVEAEVTLGEVESGTARLLQLDGSRLEVKIPAGVADGQRIRLSGKAGPGPGAGDIYVRVKVPPHRAFGREGANLTREVRVTLREALLGHDVPVETLSGKRLLLRVPAGTQPGRIFRLRGQGLPRFRSDGRGDLLVHVRVVLPSELTEGERELAERFLEAIEQPDPRSPTHETPPPRAPAGARNPPPEAGTRP
jgi:DnaJ-class molecular chaperone